MRPRSIILSLLILVLLSKSAEAKFFWFFDEPKVRQDITLVVDPQDKAAGLDRFVGHTIKLIPKDASTEEIDVPVMASHKFNGNMQLRILMPDTVAGEYTVEVPGLKKDEELLPKEVKIAPKVYDAILLIKKAKKAGEKKE